MLPTGRIFATLEFTYEVLSEEYIKGSHIKKALETIPIYDSIYDDIIIKGDGKYRKELPVKIKLTYNNKVITWAVALSRVGNTDILAEMQRGRQYRDCPVITRRKKDVKIFPNSRRPVLKANEKKAIEYMYRNLHLGVNAIGRALNIDTSIIGDYIRELGIMRNRCARVKSKRLKLKGK